MPHFSALANKIAVGYAYYYEAGPLSVPPLQLSYNLGITRDMLKLKVE